MKQTTFKNKRKPWGSVYGTSHKKVSSGSTEQSLYLGFGFKKSKGLTTKTTLKARTSLKAKKNIRKVGKVGKANINARGLIADYAKKMNLTSCEIGPLGLTTGCTKTWPVAPAHRHKRAWYKGDAIKLSLRSQWVVACQCCHDQIEHNKELTEEVFTKLRGSE
jgi:hypothetical protein